jgi:hypothetical protein
MLKKTVRLSVLLLLIGFPSLPQFEVREVTGVVTDERGNALPGAAVLLENLNNLSIMSYRWVLLLQRFARRYRLYLESRVPELLF